jgi:hypothetical protein
MAQRTPEQVTSEIAHEREQLASAVANLRGELKEATNVKAKLKAHAPKIAAGAVVIVAAIAVKTLLSRRARQQAEARELFSFGRFTIVERD